MRFRVWGFEMVEEGVSCDVMGDGWVCFVPDSLVCERDGRCEMYVHYRKWFIVIDELELS